jgi:TadE-like protein
MSSHHRRKRRPPGDRGAVTVETAIALSAFVVVLGLMMYGLMAVLDQVRCVDAAREAARLTARGEIDQAKDAASRIAPDGASIQVDVEGEHIQVDVLASPPGDMVPGVELHAVAFAVREPGG